jgi:hypothetical protein
MKDSNRSYFIALGYNGFKWCGNGSSGWLYTLWRRQVYGQTEKLIALFHITAVS